MAAEVTGSPRGLRTFFDTNVLLYSDDPRDLDKQQTALRLIKEHMLARTGVLSLQVLQEYFASARGKLKLSGELAKRRVEVFAKFQVCEPNVGDLLAAIDLHRLHEFSLWDALVIQMAKKSASRVLLSEDMQDDREIDGVRIVNPFRQ